MTDVEPFFFLCIQTFKYICVCDVYSIPGRSFSWFPAFSKNMASCRQKKSKQRKIHSKKLPHHWRNKIHKLTIKKHAPIMTAFMRTSKSIGNLMPKKSASVKISRAKPDHCLEILPTSSPSNVTICKWCTKRINVRSINRIYTWVVSHTLNSTSPQRLNVHNGPSMRKTVWPVSFLMENCGKQIDHSCSTVPIRLPGGADTSMLCKQHGKKQLEQANGRCKWTIWFL